MKTINTKSLLLGILATVLVFTLTSGKSSESGNLNVSVHQFSLFVHNKTTNTLYSYAVRSSFTGGGFPEKPTAIYTLGDDGSSLARKEN
jgi:hypothetical protein